jgi:hypothetical protein
MSVKITEEKEGKKRHPKEQTQRKERKSGTVNHSCPNTKNTNKKKERKKNKSRIYC